MKKINAMSLLSLLLILTMIAVMMAASVPLISQNLTQISKGKKKAGETSLTEKNGYFICYYNANGNLCYKQVESDANNNINLVGTNIDSEGNCTGTECRFVIPNADLFEITLVGGGGGGANTKIKNDFDYVLSTESLELGASNQLLLTSLFKNYRSEKPESDIRNALNTLLNDVIVSIGSGNGDGNECARSISFKDISFGEAGWIFDFNDAGDITSFGAKIKHTDGRETEVPDYSFGYNHLSRSCTTDVNSGNMLYYGHKYGMMFKFGSSDRAKTIMQGENLDINLATYATILNKGNSGDVGEVIVRKVSFIGNVNDVIRIGPGGAGEIGRGGEGGNEAHSDDDSIKGQNGTATTLRIGNVVMIANGGAGGSTNQEINYLKKITATGKGKSGVKPEFYIPSALGINQKNLTVGIGSGCYFNANENVYKCSNVQESTYPGSSGASSGYYIGNDKIDELQADVVRVEIELDGSAEGGGNNKFSLEPLGYTYDESSQRPTMHPATSVKGGKGANGAILISW